MSQILIIEPLPTLKEIFALVLQHKRNLAENSLMQIELNIFYKHKFVFS